MIAIRPYRRDDRAALADIFARAVRATASRHYSPEQITAWLADGPEAADIESKNGDGRLALVAAGPGGNAVGWIDLEADGHIDMLFVSPDFSGRGIASRLYSAVQAEAGRRNLQSLYVEASEAARPVFAHWGFATTARRDFLLQGVMIHNYAMRKFIVPAR